MDSKKQAALLFQIFFVGAGLFLIITGITILFMSLDKEPSNFLHCSLVFPASMVGTWNETKWLFSNPILRVVIGGTKIIVGIYFVKLSTIFKKIIKGQ